MAAKVGGFLGLATGWIVWQMVGGIGGLLLAVLLVVPIASAAFIGLFSMMGGSGKQEEELSIADRGSAPAPPQDDGLSTPAEHPPA